MGALLKMNNKLKAAFWTSCVNIAAHTGPPDSNKLLHSSLKMIKQPDKHLTGLAVIGASIFCLSSRTQNKGKTYVKA